MNFTYISHLRLYDDIKPVKIIDNIIHILKTEWMQIGLEIFKMKCYQRITTIFIALYKFWPFG